MGGHTFCLFSSLAMIGRNIRQISQILLIGWSFRKTQMNDKEGLPIGNNGNLYHLIQDNSDAHCPPDILFLECHFLTVKNEFIPDYMLALGTALYWKKVK